MTSADREDLDETKSRSGFAPALARELLLGVLFVLLAIAYTWPLARNLDRFVADPGDPFLNTWILDWSMHALTHQPLRLFDAPMFAGAKYSLAFSEHLVGVALLVLPIKLLTGASPLVMYNLAILLGFALSGYGATVLARTVGASLFAAILAGISFGFGQFFFDHLSHLQIISSGWVPLTLAALLFLLRKPTWPRTVLFSAAFVMNGLTNIYWLLFTGFACVATIAFLCWIDPTTRRAPLLKRVAAGVLIASLVLLPFLLPYRVVSKLYGMERGWAEASAGSADLADYLRGTDRNLKFRGSGLPMLSERQLSPGVLPLALAFAVLFLTRRRAKTDLLPTLDPASPSVKTLARMDRFAVALIALSCLAATQPRGIEIESGQHHILLLDASSPLFLAFLLILWRWTLRLPDVFRGDRVEGLTAIVRRSRFWPYPWIGALWVAIGVTASLGTHAFLYGFLFHNLSPYRSTRVPGRWAILAYVGLIILMALGADLLLRRITSASRRRLAAALLLFVACADTAVSLHWHSVDPRLPRVYQWLRDTKQQGPIFELPMVGEGIPFRYLLGLAEHRVPLINGTSGFAPPFDRALMHLNSRNEFNDVFLAQLRALDAQLLIVHTDILGPQRGPILDWLQRAQNEGRLTLVRRFESGPDGDFVFAFGPQAAQPDTTRDPAGHTVQDNWNRLLQGEAIFNAGPSFSWETPAAGSEFHRLISVRGWAVAPSGIRSVEVQVDQARRTFAAVRVARPDLTSRAPWYPHDPLPGFEFVLPQRPKGIPRHTDIQLRITDNEGNVVLSDPRLVVWH
jgi:hypothetical protein